MLGHVEFILPDRGYPNIGVKYIFYQRWIYRFECDLYWMLVSCYQRQLHNHLTHQFEIFQLVNIVPRSHQARMCDFKQQFQIQIGTIVDVLGEKSDADWELVAVPDENIDVCRGHLAMADLQSELVVRRRSEHVLAQKLRNCPLPHDIILLDCPATLGKIILARNLKSLDRDCLSISSSNYAEEL